MWLECYLLASNLHRVTVLRRTVQPSHHLKRVNRGYFDHAKHALSLSAKLMKLSLLGVVHAVSPGMCTNSMSRGVDRVKYLIWKDHQRSRRASQAKRGLVGEN